MLYIATALYLEAQPFITAYQLKQNAAFTKFQVFSNEHIHLIITGTGELKASIAITDLLSHQELTSQDLLLNFGMCASMDSSIPAGTCYLFHQLHQQTTGRDLYPDCLLKLSYPESELETCPGMVQSQEDRSLVTKPFADMEGYAVMYAASYYLQPHQILFLKMVSDYGDSTVDPSIIPMLQSHLNDAARILMEQLSSNFPDFHFFPQALLPIRMTDGESSAFEQICSCLHLSETMRHALIQHVLYYKSQRKDVSAVLEHSRNDVRVLSCKSKTEGKQYFEQLKIRLME